MEFHVLCGDTEEDLARSLLIGCTMDVIPLETTLDWPRKAIESIIVVYTTELASA